MTISGCVTPNRPYVTVVTKTFRLHTRIPACDNFGEVHTTQTDVVESLPTGGVRVTSRRTGTIEGDRIDDFGTDDYPEATFEAACAWRRRNGYVEVA